MKNLAEIKERLKEELPEQGINHVIKSLQNLIPENSPKYEALLELKKDYKELKVQIISGLSVEKKMDGEAAISSRIFELINLLEESDFDPNAQKSNLSEDHTIKKGHLLYKVPQKMQLGKESRCLVRIAFDKAMLVEDLDIDEDTEFRADIRISDCMKVVIDDSINPDAFDIREGSKPIQFVDQDDFTEWRFFVKPLLPGEHILEIKVSIMLEVNGETRVRERVLEESIIIVSEEVEEETPFKKLDEGILLAQGAVMVPSKNTKGGSAGRSSKKGSIPFVTKMMAMGLTLIVAAGGIYMVSKYFSPDVNPIDDIIIPIDTTEVTSTDTSGNTIPIDSIITPTDTTAGNPGEEDPTEEDPTENPNPETPDDETIEENPPSVNPLPPSSPKFIKLPPFTDPRDSFPYPIVKIGDQVWMTTNLNFEPPDSCSWCFQDKPEYCQEFGRLYNWHCAKIACPNGWHLPTKNEWVTLFEYVGATPKPLNPDGSQLFKNQLSAFEELTKNETLNFFAKFGGERDIYGNYSKPNSYGVYWTSTKGVGLASITAGFSPFGEQKIYINQFNEKAAFSCRCVKD